MTLPDYEGKYYSDSDQDEPDIIPEEPPPPVSQGIHKPPCRSNTRPANPNT